MSMSTIVARSIKISQTISDEKKYQHNQKVIENRWEDPTGI